MFSFFIFVHSTAADAAEATLPLEITTCPVPAVLDTQTVVTRNPQTKADTLCQQIRALC